MPGTLMEHQPPTVAQEPSPQPAPDGATATRVAQPTVEHAQAMLEKAQSAWHGLQAQRGGLVAAYCDAVERADGDRMVELDRQLRELDRQLHAADVRLDAARIGAERAAVQVAEDQSRAIGMRLEAARADLRAARAQRQAAYDTIAQEREALAAEFEADSLVRALIDEDRTAAQQLSWARARLEDAIKAGRRRIE